MPRAFATAERSQIEAQLIDSATKTFASRGLKRTNIAELAREAGIAKGTFYLFFASKEALFVAVALRVEAAMRAALRAEVDAGHGLERVLRTLMALFVNNPVLRVLSDREEATALFRSLTKEQTAQLHSDDVAFFDALLRRMKSRVKGVQIAAFARAVFVLGMEQTVLGREDRDVAIELMIRGLTAKERP